MHDTHAQDLAQTIRPASGMSPRRTRLDSRITTQEDPHPRTVVPKRKIAVTEMHMALASSASFDDLVAALKVTLTVPELPGFKGCRPCLSGLDRFIIEDIAARGIH